MKGTEKPAEKKLDIKKPAKKLDVKKPAPKKETAVNSDDVVITVGKEGRHVETHGSTPAPAAPSGKETRNTELAKDVFRMFPHFLVRDIKYSEQLFPEWIDQKVTSCPICNASLLGINPRIHFSYFHSIPSKRVDEFGRHFSARKFPYPEYQKVSASIKSMISADKSEEVAAKYEEIQKVLDETVKTVYPDAIFNASGVFGAGVWNSISTLEFDVYVPGAKYEDVLGAIKKELDACGKHEIMKLHNRRVIQYFDKGSSASKLPSYTIHPQRFTSYLASAYFKDCFSIDERAQLLVEILMIWAETNGLMNLPGICITTNAIMCLATHFLTRVTRPAVLPDCLGPEAIAKGESEDEPDVDLCSVDFEGTNFQWAVFKKFTSNSKKSVCQLLVEFLQYYGFKHDFGRVPVNIGNKSAVRDGANLPAHIIDPVSGENIAPRGRYFEEFLFMLRVGFVNLTGEALDIIKFLKP